MQKDIKKVSAECSRSTPQLRFKEFTEDWETKKYNTIYSFYSTNSFSRDNLNYDYGKVKNIHYGDIHTKFSTLFNINEELVPYVNNDIDLSKVKNENYLKEGDLLIADASEDYNDIGKTIEVINLNNEKVISGLHTFHARPNKHKMALGFSGFMLQNWDVRKQVMKIAQGTKVLGIATSRLGKINLNIPSLQEQQKIATFLSAVDKKLSLLQEKKDLLEGYKKGVMQQLFKQKLRFKFDNGGDNSSWVRKKLEDVSDIKRGAGSQYLKYVKDETKGIRLIRIGDFLGSTEPVFIENSDSIKRFRLKKDDILIAGTGATAGITFKVPDEFIGLVFSYNAPRIKVKNVNSNFITYFLKSDYILRQQRGLFTGNAQPFLDTKSIGNFKILLPPLEEQTKIANFLTAIDNKIQLVAESIEATKEFKKGLLQQLFV